MRLSSFASSIALFALAAAACSSSSNDVPADSGIAADALDDSAEAAPSDVRAEAPSDAPGLPPGVWRSYTATITAAKDTSTTGTGTPPLSLTPPSLGWVGRIDLYRETSGDGSPGRIRAFVVSPPYGAPTGGLASVDLASITLSGTHDATLISAYGVDKGNTTVDSIDAISLYLDPTGAPATATFTGRTDETAGDVAWEYSLAGSMTFVPDTIAPTARASSTPAFASVALPWDLRVLVASEPYEEHLTLAQLVGASAAPKDFVVTPTVSVAWGVDKERGATFITSNWDGAADLALPALSLSDWAGNHGVVAAAAPAPYGGAKVASHGAPSWRADDGKAPALMWGAAATTTTGCESGSCVAIGPFPLTYACDVSHGGFATRLRGGGTATVRVRAIATPTVKGASGPPSQQFLYMAIATPGGTTATVGQATSVLWGSAAIDGSYDTGWANYTLASDAAAAESGVALSAGGIGAATCGGSSSFTPAPFTTTVFIEQVSLAPHSATAARSAR